MNRLRCALSNSRSVFALGAAASGLVSGGRSAEAHTEATLVAEMGPSITCDGNQTTWHPNTTTTKYWHFYKGKMNPNSAKSLKLFKCAETPIADEIADYLGVSLNTMQVKNFADGETSIVVDDGVRGKRVYIVCSTTTVDRIMELLLSISAMRRSSAKSITAVIPFYGYARQDRMHKGREPVAAADIARMLEVMGVNHVVTVDLHSAQIEGFFKPSIPVDNLQAFPVGAVYFSELQLKDPIVIAPHSSAVYRAVQFRNILSKAMDEAVPIAFVVRKHQINKDRPGELVGDVDGKDCVIVDNLVDTGTTLIKTAQILKSYGAKSVSAFCVHGRFSDAAVRDLNACEDLDRLVTTNTIPAAHDSPSGKIVTLSVAPFIAEVISCIHTKGSIIQVTKTNVSCAAPSILSHKRTMMTEDKKPRLPSEELEFIGSVGSHDSDGSTVASSVESPRAGRDDEALLTSMRKVVTNAKHPVAAFFHLLFKALALFVYIFGGAFSSSYVFVFVVCILLLAFDFWTVKNVTGRLLVGLRWWNRINEDGSSEWVFESHEDMTEIDALDSRVFWVGLYATPVVWVLLLIVAVLKFNVQWALLIVVAVLLNAANIIGYTKCKKDAKQKMQSLMSRGALGALGTSAGSTIMSTIGGLAFSGGIGGGAKPTANPNVTV